MGPLSRRRAWPMVLRMTISSGSVPRPQRHAPPRPKWTRDINSSMAKVGREGRVRRGTSALTAGGWSADVQGRRTSSSCAKEHVTTAKSARTALEGIHARKIGVHHRPAEGYEVEVGGKPGRQVVIWTGRRGVPDRGTRPRGRAGIRSADDGPGSRDGRPRATRVAFRRCLSPRGSRAVDRYKDGA